MLNHLTRAQMLMEQSRYAMAVNELRKCIAEEPNHAVPHALMGICLSAMSKREEAIRACEEAVGLGPDIAYCHYAMAAVLLKYDQYKSAMAAVQQAIELEPENADYHSLQAAIHVEQRDWKDALSAAEQALQFDSEHSQANNLRAIALTNLGRRDEAGATIDATLSRQPENSTTHANQGWTLLHAGEAMRAAEHFREALRIEPDNEWARAGIVEALKARNFFYRWFLRYMLWMSRLKPRVQFALFIGIILVIQLLLRLPEEGPIRTFGFIIAICYMVFAMTSWIANPLFNLLLRFNSFGRMALTDDQRRDSNWMALALITVGVMVMVTALHDFRTFDVVLYLLLLLPLSVTLNIPRSMRKQSANVITLGLYAVGLVHFYRWHVAELPLSVEEIEILLNGTMEESLQVDLKRINEFKALGADQNSLQNIFVWGCILMTWLQSIFKKAPS